jgi:Flp pilus assembly protein TadG
VTSGRVVGIVSRVRQRVREVHACDDDRGLGTVEAVLTVPVIVLMIVGAVQVGLWWYSRQMAETAAQEAARVARSYNATAAAGQAEGYSYLSKVDGGGTALQNPTIQVTRGATTVTVTVKGDVASLVPWVSPTVTITVTSPREAYVPAGDR